MSEVLFRGKRKDFDQEWCYGFYSLFNNNRGMKPAIITGTEQRCFIPVEIIPETKGQFTGLYDGTEWDELTTEEQAEFLYPLEGGKRKKEEWKGKPIFEGDIIKAWFKVAGQKNGCYAIGFVIYEGDGFKIKVTASHNARSHAEYTDKNQTAYYIVHNFVERNYALEVIGNIHDNPELLKGGGKMHKE